MKLLPAKITKKRELRNRAPILCLTLLPDRASGKVFGIGVRFSAQKGVSLYHIDKFFGDEDKWEFSELN